MSEDTESTPLTAIEVLNGLWSDIDLGFIEVSDVDKERIWRVLVEAGVRGETKRQNPA